MIEDSSFLVGLTALTEPETVSLWPDKAASKPFRWI